LYVNCNIPSSRLGDYCLCDDNAEICTAKITIGNIHYIVSSLYRPHDKHHNVNEFNTFIDNFLSQSIFLDNQTILTGDFNINLLEHDTYPPANDFSSTMRSLDYFPHTSRPTRFPDGDSAVSPSLLDHIGTNFTAPFSSGIFFPLSDHLPTFLNIPILERVRANHKITFRIKNAGNYARFK